MKNICIVIFLFASIMSCQQKQDYIPEKCQGIKAISHTDKLKILDTLPGFSSVGKAGLPFKDLNREKIFIFFKKER